MERSRLKRSRDLFEDVQQQQQQDSQPQHGHNASIQRESIPIPANIYSNIPASVERIRIKGKTSAAIIYITVFPIFSLLLK